MALTDNPVYQKLEPRQTRRVWLRSQDGALHFELEVVSIDAAIDNDDFEHNSNYLALSYTWGEHDTVNVAVRGLNGQLFPVSVTKSLLVACECIHTRILARNPQAIPLWIDQLSMNQADHDEKISQIRLMRDIYEASRNVVVWLGLADSTSDAALTRIHDIRDTMQKLHDAGHKYRADNGKIELAYMPVLAGPNADENFGIWKSMLKLLDRPWFSRVWIIQEGTAKKPFTNKTYVVCGATAIIFDDFLRLYYLIVTMQPAHWDGELTRKLMKEDLYHHVSFHMICDFWMQKQAYSYFHLIDLLQIGRVFNAFDLRDKIYAIASFASDAKSAKHELKLSYQKSVQQTFIDFVVWHVREYGNLDFLGHLHRDLDGNVLNRIPAWVPDWSRPSAQIHHPYHEMIFTVPQTPLYWACGKDRLNNLTISGDIGVTATLQALTVSGVRLTSISAWSPRVEDCEGFGVTMMQSYCPLNKVPLAHVYARTLCMDSNLGLRTRRLCTTRGAYYHQDTQCPQGYRDCFHNFAGIPDLDRSNRELTQGHHWFMLQPREGEHQGVMGLGYTKFVDGDELWTLEGGKMLYILRPWNLQDETCIHKLDVTGYLNTPQGYLHPQGSKMYQFIGETFVLGLMDGEVLDMLGDEPKQLRPACLEEMDRDFHKIDILSLRDLSEKLAVERRPQNDDEMHLVKVQLGSGDDTESLKQLADKKQYWPPEVFTTEGDTRTIFSKPSDVSPPFLTFHRD